jgi:site-specific DNA-methyltransferase (adenine-specific)
MMEWLVKLLSNEGDVVLDCFNGSGTTGVACKKLGRNYIGIEMNPEFIEVTKRRLADCD